MKIKGVLSAITKKITLPQQWYLSEAFAYNIFFLFCTFGLFLGDGKQPFIDLFAIMLVLFLYSHAYIFKISIKPFPRILHYGWMLYIGISIIGTILSDSIGLSISATVRTITLFLLVQYFYGRKSENTLKIFISGLLKLSLFAIFASFFFIVFPNWAIYLPSMNLVYASFGHNQLAGLLFLSLPLVLHTFLEKSTLKNILLFSLFFVAFFLSFARGAFILFCIYLIFLVIRYVYTKKYIQSLFLFSILAFFILILATLGLLAQYKTTPLPISYWLRKQITKPFALEDTRLLYWKQAWSAFKDAPLLGHGPGTFYLLSKRYQEAPNQYSYYAHSLPLETLAEQGIIGSILYGLLLFILIKNICKNSLFNSNSKLITHGLILFLTYSFVEFNFNFLVLCALFWTGIINFVRWPTKLNHYVHFKVDNSLLLLVITLYYLLSTSSLFLNSAKSHRVGALSTYIAPFDRFQVIKISTHSENDLNTLLSPNIAFLHAKDPEVLMHYATNSGKESEELFNTYAEAAIINDPMNFTYMRSYLQKQLENKNNLQQIRSIISKTVKNFNSNTATLNRLDTNFESQITHDMIQQIYNQNNYRHFFAKLYYLVGLDMLASTPHKSREYWREAGLLLPQSGLIFHERASLEHYIFKDDVAAHKIISNCNSIPTAHLHCLQIEKDFSNLTKPGTLMKEIIEQN